MNFKLIEKLKQTTPSCFGCHSTTHFVMGAGYQYLKCDNCGEVTKAPTSLTRTIIAAYNIPEKNTDQNRIQPCIL